MRSSRACAVALGSLLLPSIGVFGCEKVRAHTFHEEPARPADSRNETFAPQGVVPAGATSTGVVPLGAEPIKPSGSVSASAMPSEVWVTVPIAGDAASAPVVDPFVAHLDVVREAAVPCFQNAGEGAHAAKIHGRVSSNGTVVSCDASGSDDEAIRGCLCTALERHRFPSTDLGRDVSVDVAVTATRVPSSGSP
jgi:hypothetical protein